MKNPPRPTRNLFPLLVLIIYPWALLISPVFMLFTLVGVMISVSIYGGGWENLGVGLVGGLISLSVGIIIIGTFLVFRLFKTKSTLQKILLSIVAVAYGFGVIFLIGNHTEIKNFLTGRRDDAQRLVNLQKVKNQIENYHSKHKQLPDTLADVSFSKLEKDEYTDPVTHAEFQYIKGEGENFQLCAVFDKKGELQYMISYGGRLVKKQYLAGNSCLQFNVKEYGYFKFR